MILLKPTQEDVRGWGPLAYVSLEERHKVMAMPLSERSIFIDAIRKEIDGINKRCVE